MKIPFNVPSNVRTGLTSETAHPRRFPRFQTTRPTPNTTAFVQQGLCGGFAPHKPLIRLVLGLSAWRQRFRSLHGALHLLGARLRSTSTKLYTTIPLRHGNWTNLHRCNPPLFQVELAGRFRTDIDQPVTGSWSAIRSRTSG